jgi:hypothetical protein
VLAVSGSARGERRREQRPLCLPKTCKTSIRGALAFRTGAASRGAERPICRGVGGYRLLLDRRARDGGSLDRRADALHEACDVGSVSGTPETVMALLDGGVNSTS